MGGLSPPLLHAALQLDSTPPAARWTLPQIISPPKLVHISHMPMKTKSTDKKFQEVFDLPTRSWCINFSCKYDFVL